MGNPIRLYRDFAFSTQAAYLGFAPNEFGDAQALVAKLRAGTGSPDNSFTTAQSDQFAATTQGYVLRHHSPGSFFSSGFSASVFESSERPGEFTFAVRGTEPVAGIINDLLVTDGLGVALSGIARAQTISAYRYYKQLTTPAGEPVRYSTSELLMLAALRTGTPTGPLTALFTTSAYIRAIGAGFTFSGLAR